MLCLPSIDERVSVIDVVGRGWAGVVTEGSEGRSVEVSVGVPMVGRNDWRVWCEGGCGV